MQAIFGDRIGEIWIPDLGPRNETVAVRASLACVQRSQLLQQFRLLALAGNAREETLKEILGVFASRLSFITTSLAIGPRCAIKTSPALSSSS